MEYTKHNFRDGDTLHARQLNEMDDQIEQLGNAVEGKADKSEIPSVPDHLPNPHALTLTGAVQATYDGSGPITVEIPQGGGGGTVTDVQVGGVSVMTDGVANVPIASVNTFGVFKPSGTYGTQVNATGNLASVTRTAEQYAEASNALIVGKGTLDNVLAPVKSQISQLETDKANKSEVPSDAHINGLIDTALGVVENGYY